MDFKKFQAPVSSAFKSMAGKQIFRVDCPGDDLWDHYLKSFPEGSNPIFRERTEHDCSCCRQFVKNLGGVVVLEDGKMKSIWDCKIDDPNYQAVADAMSNLVNSRRIANIFLHGEKHVGAEKNYEDADGTITTWNHFHADIPHGRNQGINAYMLAANIPSKLGETRSTYDVFKRSLDTITADAIDTVLDLIKQKSLYRGDEQKFVVTEFSKLKKEFDKLGWTQDFFIWEKSLTAPASVTRIRNTAIGTLLINISEDMDLEKAVDKFESMMDARNYKRPTALVTKAQVEKAKETLARLNLIDALERRFAHLSDISVNNILFVDREARKSMMGGADAVFDTIATKNTQRTLDKVEEVSIEQFINEIVPRASSIEIMLENKHASNLVSLIAPMHQDSRPFFKWQNRFSWAYNGDVADSVKERVKKAGGNVTGDLCCRLAWNNNDDLDFHMIEPGRGRTRGGHIYYGSFRRSRSPAGGMLDIDMNGADGMCKDRQPVENIFYADRRTMIEGTYELAVQQFSKRENVDVGFEVEIEYLGEVTRFVYDKAVTQGARIVVAKFKYTHAKGIEFIDSLQSSKSVRMLWELPTQSFHRVSTVMASPNHWDGQGVGNKHWFFMIDGCKNDEGARPFFNEHLSDDLKDHRKVLEIVGGKMKVEPSTDQLSGLGFSSTQRNELLARVKGSFTRTVKVVF
jgi:hypothetical protein